MKQKVLILEDDGAIFEMLDEALNNQYELKRAQSVDEAYGEYLESIENNSEFFCYVIDLQLFSSGLTPEEMVEFRRVEGYGFLKKYLFKDKTDKQISQLKKRIIICSRYVREFKSTYKKEASELILIDKKPGLGKTMKQEMDKIAKEYPNNHPVE